MTPTRPDSPALRIFVIEDHSDSLQALRIYLEYQGMSSCLLAAKQKPLKKYRPQTATFSFRISAFRTAPVGN